MPVGTANYKRLYRRVALALNALQASTYANATPTLNDRRRPVEAIIRDAIVQKDAAVGAAICMSEKSGHRPRYLAYSSELNYGSDGPPTIPDHYGPIGQVIIRKATIDGTYIAGVEAESIEQINQWRENFENIFGSTSHQTTNSVIAGFFKEAGKRLNFTGYGAKVEIATFAMSDEATNPPVLVSPDAFEDVVYAGAVGDCAMEGDTSEEIQTCRSYYDRTLPLIVAGAFEVPPLQQK